MEKAENGGRLDPLRQNLPLSKRKWSAGSVSASNTEHTELSRTLHRYTTELLHASARYWRRGSSRGRSIFHGRCRSSCCIRESCCSRESCYSRRYSYDCCCSSHSRERYYSRGNFYSLMRSSFGSGSIRKSGCENCSSTYNFVAALATVAAFVVAAAHSCSRNSGCYGGFSSTHNTVAVLTAVVTTAAAALAAAAVGVTMCYERLPTGLRGCYPPRGIWKARLRESMSPAPTA